jgi:hypothetical protein
MKLAGFIAVKPFRLLIAIAGGSADLGSPARKLLEVSSASQANRAALKWGSGNHRKTRGADEKLREQLKT